ncbi:hypothetical protein A134_23250 [Vibrio crassostreae 9CS106]|uniref:Uncharacterized protein n=1 Tax=Vibrio crassostreae 9CS106 TaxID=1191300 RepID=A0A1B1C3F8_9VIBR|nr:hypothetical protein A134_23250 [Vibrio crassostreae 9CS106]
MNLKKEYSDRLVRLKVGEAELCQSNSPSFVHSCLKRIKAENPEYKNYRFSQKKCFLIDQKEGKSTVVYMVTRTA